PAVDLHVVEHQIKLVEVGAAVRPDRFGDSTHNHHTTIAGNGPDVHVTVQLGIVGDVLPQDAQHHFRDGQAHIGQGSFFLDAVADLGQVILDVLTGEKQ